MSATANLPATFGVDVPRQRDRAAVGRVADRVRHEIAEGARELVARAGDERGVVRGQSRDDRVPAGRQRPRLRGELGDQGAHRERHVDRRVLLALERGQREEIVDETLHVARLLRDEAQETLPLPRVEVEVLQRLDEARDDGERRLELVRDVGDELAPHPRRGFDPRDVPREQELLLVAVGHDLDRQGHTRLALRRDDDRLGKVAGLEIADHFGLAHEIADHLPLVALGIEAQMGTRACVGEADAIRVVEHHDAFGNRLGRGGEPLEPLREAALHGDAGADAPVEAGEGLPPAAAPLGHRGIERPFGPAREQVELPEVKDDDGGGRDRKHAKRPGGAENEPCDERCCGGAHGSHRAA